MFAAVCLAVAFPAQAAADIVVEDNMRVEGAVEVVSEKGLFMKAPVGGTTAMPGWIAAMPDGQKFFSWIAPRNALSVGTMEFYGEYMIGQNSVGIHGWAEGKDGVAIGANAYADGEGSVALGGASSQGAWSFAAIKGRNYGPYSIAMMHGINEGGYSISVGKDSMVEANSTGSMAISGGYVYGKYGIAFGPNSRANAAGVIMAGEGLFSAEGGSVVFGKHNKMDTYEFGASFPATDDRNLFILGNGASSANRSNAVAVLRNGRTLLTNKYWSAENPTEVPESPLSSDGFALEVEGHVRMNGKVILSQPQGDILMGVFGQ